MSANIFSDRSLLSARFALDGLARRTEVIGNNLANVDTPGYQAQSLNFEQALKGAITKTADTGLNQTHPGHLPASKDLLRTQIEPRRSGSWRADGNNVDVDIELNQMAETGIRYQALTQLVNKKYTILKTIAASR